jgi:hypothetical protein
MDYIKPTNPIPHSYKEFSRMITEHKEQCAEVSNSHMFIVFFVGVSVRLVLGCSRVGSSIIRRDKLQIIYR